MGVQSGVCAWVPCVRVDVEVEVDADADGVMEWGRVGLRVGRRNAQPCRVAAAPATHPSQVGRESTSERATSQPASQPARPASHQQPMVMMMHTGARQRGGLRTLHGCVASRAVEASCAYVSSSHAPAQAHHYHTETTTIAHHAWQPPTARGTSAAQARQPRQAERPQCNAGWAGLVLVGGGGEVWWWSTSYYW
jgi:hypothetical protein